MRPVRAQCDPNELIMVGRAGEDSVRDREPGSVRLLQLASMVDHDGARL